VEEVKLYEEELFPLTLKEIQLREKSAKNKDFSGAIFNLPKQFANADVIVISAPYWDLMFPAVVKSYFEKITVNGLTFAYSKNGIPYGLCKAKNLFTLQRLVDLSFIILVMTTLVRWQNVFMV
jgi:FMN-dependent NADH-azoreductase